MKQVELLILGAGPAGLAAASEAVRAGASVALLDENPRAGGQIFRQLDDGFTVTEPGRMGRDYLRGRKLLAEFAAVRKHLTYLDRALVWGIMENNEVAFVRGRESSSFRFGKLIIAAGAYDRPVPFPGWTLPGVTTAGGAQTLVKTQRVLPGEKILIAGTGPLLLALANQIADAGGQVAAIVEAGGVENRLHLARAAWGQWPLVADAARYLWGVLRRKIPLLTHHIIVEARGGERVEAAAVAEVDANWRPKPGLPRLFSVDAVAVGYGFVPSVELSRLAGCHHHFDPRLGGWIPTRGETMQTSIADVFAAGDCGGVAGNYVAAEQGRIAGLAAARELGHLSSNRARRLIEPCRKRLEGLKRLRGALDRISTPRPGLFELAAEDTVICRCRDILLGEIRDALAEGAVNLNEIKRRIGIGMGPCQGRMCQPALKEIVARESPDLSAEPGFFNPRPPVKPIPLTTLANISRP